MNIKRILTGTIGFAIIMPFIIYTNKYIMDIFVCIVALISIYEFSSCAKKKNIKTISWVGYLSCILIAILHILPEKLILLSIAIGFPLIIFILFLHIILSNLKFDFRDISITLFEILYVIGFTMFFSVLYGSNISVWGITGKIAIWYVLFASWGSDVFAYFVGSHFGKHKFSKISPNKTIEGCLGGIIGAIIFGLVYHFCICKYLDCTVPIVFTILSMIILGIIGQIGDFSASAIKRYFEVKDFGKLFPGHGRYVRSNR